MIFQVRSVKNGLILKVAPEEQNISGDEIVYQEKFDDEVDCFAGFLHYLSEEYGPATSRCSPKRIYITVEPGDKYEDQYTL